MDLNINEHAFINIGFYHTYIVKLFGKQEHIYMYSDVRVCIEMSIASIFY